MMCNRRVYRVFRGGSWGGVSRYARVACRFGDAPGYRVVDLSLRFAKGPVGDYRVARGGSWFSRPGNARVACRFRDASSFRDGYLGVRFAKGKLP